MSKVIINFILFQIGWFACVLSGAAEQPMIGVLVAAFIIAFHLWQSDYPGPEFFLLIIAMGIGVLWDSLLVAFSLLNYKSGIFVANIAPYWIVALWALFASTLNVSLRWLKYKYLTSAMLGSIAGPLAYYGGSRLGALEFINFELALILLALGWAVFTPLLVKLSRNFDGYPELSRRSS
jgi:hypothetical protein